MDTRVLFLCLYQDIILSASSCVLAKAQHQFYANFIFVISIICREELNQSFACNQ
jgi:hypothetical protein